jgi:hypothetical protein
VKISFDLDGVLCDFSHPAIKAIRALYRPDLPEDYEMQQWSFADIITADQWDHVFHFLMAIDNLWTNLPPHRENVTALQEYIAAHGEEDVYFVTARPECRGGSARSMTGLWLFEHGLPIHNLIMAPSHGAKQGILAAAGIAYHLDDYAPTIRACQGLAGLRAFVLDRKYNQGEDDLPRVYSAAEYLWEVEANG